MRMGLSVLATLCLSVSACSFSDVDPDAEVHISGRALDPAGKPLRDARVLLIKQPDLGEVVFGTVLTVGTLSTVCFANDAPAICDKAEVTTTDEDGSYAFDLKGSDTQGTLGTESTMSVVFSAEAGSASTSISFTVEESEVSLPAARLWRSRTKVAQTGGAIRLAWRPLPRAAGDDPAYTAQLWGRHSTPIWTEPVSPGEATLDPRILEDQSGFAAVGATTTLSGAEGADEVRASYLLPQVPVRRSAGVPLSRAHPCASVTGTAPAEDGAFAICRATDGDLDRPARLEGRGKQVVTGVTVDLGSRRPIDLVVGRGFSGQIVVEASADGTTYQLVASATGTAFAVRPQSPTTARFLRLRSPTGLDQSLSAEVSVW
jgi:hypothetical protein